MRQFCTELTDEVRVRISADGVTVRSKRPGPVEDRGNENGSRKVYNRDQLLQEAFASNLPYRSLNKCNHRV